jgi:phage gp29-like protein
MGWFGRLFGRAEPETKAAAPSRKSMAGRVIGEQPLYLQLQRIGGSLTPVQVSGIIREADAGSIQRLVDLANDARQKDCHLHSVLGTRELAIQSLPFQTIPFKDAKRKKPKLRDKKIADWVQETLLGISGDEKNPSLKLQDFRGLVGHLTGAAYYGHATAETITAKSGRYIVPIGFHCISQRRFRFATEDGQLEWFDMGMSDGVDLLAAHPGKFIQYLPRIMGDVGCREGLVRPLMWAALFRNWAIRDWLQLAELAWKPWRTGQYKKAAATEDIDILIETLENMTASGIAVYPETVEVKIEWPKNATSGGGQSTHSELAAFFAAEMSKAVLGQTLTTEAGNRGARSLGEVHDRVRGDIRDADATNIASVIRRHLIAPLVRMNFGNNVPIPGFEFLTQDAVDAGAMSTAVLNLRKAGLPIPCAWAYDTFGIPAPDDDEELLGPTMTDAELAKVNDGGTNEAQTQEDQKDPASPPAQDQADDASAAEKE